MSGRPDLNRRPPSPQLGALPDCATSRFFITGRPVWLVAPSFSPTRRWRLCCPLPVGGLEYRANGPSHASRLEQTSVKTRWRLGSIVDCRLTSFDWGAGRGGRPTGSYGRPVRNGGRPARVGKGLGRLAPSSVSAPDRTCGGVPRGRDPSRCCGGTQDDKRRTSCLDPTDQSSTTDLRPLRLERERFEVRRPLPPINRHSKIPNRPSLPAPFARTPAGCALAPAVGSLRPAA